MKKVLKESKDINTKIKRDIFFVWTIQLLTSKLRGTRENEDVLQA